MNDEILKKIDLLLNKIGEMEQDIKVIKDYIPATDKVKNTEYCKHAGIAYPTLMGWFKKECPRLDSRHVSKKAVDDWAASSNTRKIKEQRE